MLDEQKSREDLLLEIEQLRRQIRDLQGQNADLELVLETTALHGDTVEIQMHHLAQEMERESERRLAQFLDALPLGIAVLDAEGKPYYANRMAIQLLGKALDSSLLPQDLSQFYQVYLSGTGQLCPPQQMPIVRALGGEQVKSEDLEIHCGDRVIPIESWAMPIYDDTGKIAYALAAFQDITERKRADAERIEFTQQLAQLNEAYERFVPHEFLQFLGKDSILDVNLGDHVQVEMSVLFADIRNFSTLSEGMTPDDNFRFINSYLWQMEPAILQNHGFIDKYIGDAIMALFRRGADDAVRAGIVMLKRLREYNQMRRKAGYAPIQIGIGINTGGLMLGTVGGPNKMDGTVISDAVNLASRLEALTKEYGVPMLISNHTFSQLQDATQYAIRLVDRLQVRGKSEMVSIFEVFDADLPEVLALKQKNRLHFEQGLAAYHLHRYREAKQFFQRCFNENPEDRIAQIYCSRCEQHLEHSYYRVSVRREYYPLSPTEHYSGRQDSPSPSSQGEGEI